MYGVLCRVSTLLEILLPLMAFALRYKLYYVSTLLEILLRQVGDPFAAEHVRKEVSTLLEILPQDLRNEAGGQHLKFQPFLRFYRGP